MTLQLPSLITPPGLEVMYVDGYTSCQHGLDDKATIFAA